MRGLIVRAKSAFGRTPRPVASIQDTRAAAARKIVMERTRGNLPIQFGNYVTEDDLQREYERFRELDFDVD